jgi:hypothetical protein
VQQQRIVHVLVAAMIQSDLAPSASQIIEPMIQLACCSRSHRIIVAGSKGRELVFELHRRGYTHVATTATCGLPRGQCSVALIDWRLGSMTALERTLGWLVHFLAPAAVLVIWVDSSERSGNRKLGSILERLGFTIEAGTRCGHGFAVAARRRDAAQMKHAA